MLSYANDAPVQLKASVTQSTLQRNQPFSYTLTLSGTDVPRNPELTLPSFSTHFTVRGSQKSQSFSFDSRVGKAHRSLNFIFTLIPNQIGNITIEPATLIFNGKKYHSNRIELTVTANLSNAITQTPATQTSTIQTPTQKNYHDIFAQASVNKSTVFVGEQLIYTLELYRRIRLFSDIQHAVPSFTGFLSEPLSVDTNTTVKMLANKKFYGQYINHTALFPLDSGTKIIEPSQIGVVISVFDGQKVLKSKPLEITVKPLPKKNKPEKFSGAVGNYTLTGSLDRYTVAVGEPITYTLSLEGDGNLKSINSLHFNAPADLKLYSSNITDDISFTSKVKGKRTFEYVIIPQSPGKQRIPTFSIAYFSPQDQNYHYATINSKYITVTPIASPNSLPTYTNSTSVNSIQTDINYLKPIPSLDSKNRYPWYTFLGLLLISINLIIFACLLLFQFKNWFYRPNQQKLISKRAYTTALKQLTAINAESNSNDHTISKLYKLILVYLSSKVGVSFNGLTTDQIKTTLNTASFNKTQIDAILSLINKVSEMAYSASALTDLQQTQLIESIKETLQIMEGKRS